MFIIENSAVDQNMAGIGGSLNPATYSIIIFLSKNNCEIPSQNYSSQDGIDKL